MNSETTLTVEEICKRNSFSGGRRIAVYAGSHSGEATAAEPYFNF